MNKPQPEPSMYDTEDLKMFNMILDKLTELADDDLSSFRYEFDDGYDQFSYDDEEEEFIAKNKKMWICWHASNFSHQHPSSSRNHRVEATYTVGAQTVSISINGDLRTTWIGGGSENKDIKIKFVTLFRKIKKWQDEEIPRRQRENWINTATQAFPDILDELVLEDHSEEN